MSNLRRNLPIVILASVIVIGGYLYINGAGQITENKVPEEKTGSLEDKNLSEMTAYERSKLLINLLEPEYQIRNYTLLEETNLDYKKYIRDSKGFEWEVLNSSIVVSVTEGTRSNSAIMRIEEPSVDVKNLREKTFKAVMKGYLDNILVKNFNCESYEDRKIECSGKVSSGKRKYDFAGDLKKDPKLIPLDPRILKGNLSNASKQLGMKRKISKSFVLNICLDSKNFKNAELAGREGLMKCQG